MVAFKNGNELDLQKLFTYQSKYTKFRKFPNELQAVREVFHRPESFQCSSRQMYLEWINSLNTEEKSVDQQKADSHSLRIKGNATFNRDKKRNALAASRLYTEAIFSAPSNSEYLALAHANRAVALYAFGYFRQAYDDCECAMEQGYPIDNIQKIILRQAFCASQLNDVVRLKYHLDALDEIDLDDYYIQQKETLKKRLDEIKNNPFVPKSTDSKPNFQRDTQKILQSSTKGRYMVATTTILENTEIFSENADPFVSAGEYKICENCATTQMIPFPCYECKCVYCSIKCKEEHAHVHSFECIGNKKLLFNNVGVGHLAFRMFINGIPQILPLVSKKKNINDIWTEINTVIANREDIRYCESLRMVSHLDKMSVTDVIWFSLMSELLVLYLKEFTKFFDIFNDLAADRSQWELIASVLILKHIGQLIVNGHTCVALVMAPDEKRSPHFYQMIEDVWQTPQHIKCGKLHLFSDYEEVAAANFPYLSLCNHSCEASFQPKFSGKCVTLFATKNLSADDEIFNCYTLDYRKSKCRTRRQDLLSCYKFECMCEKCSATFPDEAYHRYHRYKCENESCRQVFTPILDDLIRLNWWDSVDGNPPKKYIRCTVCDSEQKCKWFHEFNDLLKDTQSREFRCELYKDFYELNEWLLDYHEIKMSLAFAVVMNCFSSYREGASFLNDDFDEIVKILQFYLNGIADQCRVNSIEYVVKMTYLWDIIALGKYKCNPKEIQKMLGAIETLSDDMKIVFVNYYEDFIAPKIEKTAEIP